MAILTVGTSGATYTTIAAAIAAATSADTIRLITDISENVSLNKNIAGIEGDSPTSRRTWSNSSASDLLSIDSGLNQAFLFKDLILTSNSSSSGLIYHGTVGASTAITFRNVKWNHTGTAFGHNYYNQNGGVANMLTFDKCEFVGNASSSGAIAIANSTTTNTATIKNCLFYGYSVSSSQGVIANSQTSSNLVIDVYCCTFYGNDTAYASNGRGNITDCVFIGNTDDISLGGSAVIGDFTYCGFGEQATGGTGCQFSLTAANEFVAAGSNNFHLNSGATCRNNGTTVASVTDDFDGVSRPQGSAYDIGAYEYRALGFNRGYIFG
jgi:hypothetical protein